MCFLCDWLAGTTKQQPKLMNQEGSKDGLPDTWKMYMPVRAQAMNLGAWSTGRRSPWKTKCLCSSGSGLWSMKCKSAGTMAVNPVHSFPGRERRHQGGQLTQAWVTAFLILLTSELFLSLWVSPSTWQPKGETEPWKRSDCSEGVSEKPSMGKASELGNWSLGICCGSNVPG